MIEVKARVASDHIEYLADQLDKWSQEALSMDDTEHALHFLTGAVNYAADEMRNQLSFLNTGNNNPEWVITERREQ